MKKIVIILSMVFLTFAFVACSARSGPGDRQSGDRQSGGTDKTDGTGEAGNGDSGNGETEYTTVTVVASLKAGHIVKVQASSLGEKSLSSGSCVNVRYIEKLAISAEQDNVVSQLCSNIDDNENNNCEGSYNIVYNTIADTRTGANKLTLESADRNESEDCTELFPVYTITLKSELADKTVKVYNSNKAKTLQVKDSCLKLVGGDFSGLQIDEGQGDDNRRVLCESGLCREDNYEISLFGQQPRLKMGQKQNLKTLLKTQLKKTPTPTLNEVIFSSGMEYNKSKSCEWFDVWFEE